MRSEQMKLSWEYHCPLICFLFAFALSATALMIALHPVSLERHIADADTPALLLAGYGQFYRTLSIVSLAAVLFTAVFGLWALAFYLKNEKNPKYESVRIRVRVNHIPFSMTGATFFLVLFALFAFSAMLSDITPYKRFQSFMEDVEAIENGNLATSDVYINENYERAGLAVHGKDYPRPFTRYSVTDVDGFSWYGVYVADFIDFPLDEDHLYNEYQSCGWNDVHATAYRVTYTPNHSLATSVEMIRRGED